MDIVTASPKNEQIYDFDGAGPIIDPERELREIELKLSMKGMTQSLILVRIGDRGLVRLEITGS